MLFNTGSALKKLACFSTGTPDQLVHPYSLVLFCAVCVQNNYPSIVSVLQTVDATTRLHTCAALLRYSLFAYSKKLIFLGRVSFMLFVDFNQFPYSSEMEEF